MLYLTNALSLNMYPRSGYLGLHVYELTLQQAATLLHIARDAVYNAIGHAETDELMRELLQRTFPFPTVPVGTRHTIVVSPGDGLLVAQYRGPRLGEGQKLQPTPAMFSWALVVQTDRVHDAQIKHLIREYKIGAELALSATDDPTDIRQNALWSVAVRAGGIHPRTLLEFVLWEARHWQDVCGASDSEGTGAVRDDACSNR